MFVVWLALSRQLLDRLLAALTFACTQALLHLCNLKESEPVPLLKERVPADMALVFGLVAGEGGVGFILSLAVRAVALLKLALDVRHIPAEEPAARREDGAGRGGGGVAPRHDDVHDRLDSDAEVLRNTAQAVRLGEHHRHVVRRALRPSGTATARAVEQRVEAKFAGACLDAGVSANRGQWVALRYISVAETLPPVAHGVVAEPPIARGVDRRCSIVCLHLGAGLFGQPTVGEKGVQHVLKVFTSAGDPSRHRWVPRHGSVGGLRHVVALVEVLLEEGFDRLV
mmetsp:Transcript_3580/g.8847  ORF Transcript_3580/g.8847 Transcript_3580/m.8847 type:complete len:284 (-) Transcript_3580:605-1456(-)